MPKRQLITTGSFVRLALRIMKHLPFWGRRIAAPIWARVVTWFKPPMYYAARANLRHILGKTASQAQINRTLYRLFYNTGRRYYETFYNLGHGITSAKDFRPTVIIPPETMAHFEQGLAMGRGLFVLACHISNFDLGGIALAQSIPASLQALSLADPTPDVEAFNQLRERCGAHMTPISSQALREAMERLKDGGAVVTGPDYPVHNEDKPVMFFDAPANLPSGYVRIPLRTKSPIIVLATRYEDGLYKVIANPPFELEYTGNREQDVTVNLRRILEQVEDFIRQRPDEWMIFAPVWGED
jgi:KDO2-lipid IV(A) lauroyltransferase